jgi:hypothetical protein
MGPKNIKQILFSLTMDLKNAPKKYQPNCECRKFPKNIFSQTVGPNNATKI